MYSEGHTLLDNAAAGTGNAKTITGGHYMFMCEATWGGGNIKLQIQYPGGTWVDVASSTISANGMLPFFLPPSSVRAVAATSTANYARLVRIPY